MRTKLIAACIAALALTGCTSSATEDTAKITVANAYVKATTTMMTGAFMEITNGTDADVTLTGADVTFAERAEVHEVTGGVMQKKEGGLPIAAGETQVLAPGANHLMFIGLAKPVKAGEELTFTLQFSDGTTVEVTAPVKDVNTGDEKYQGATPEASMSM